MKFTVQEIANLLNGEVKGDNTLEIDKLAKIDEEAQEGGLCFFANPKYENYLYTTKATAILISKDFVPKKNINSTLILVDDAYSAFTVLLEQYEKIIMQQFYATKIGLEQPCVVGENTKYAEGVYVGAFAYIGKNSILEENVKIFPQSYIGENVKIGKNTIIYAGAKIYENTIIGENCIIHSGAVIGSSGFGFAPQKDGTYKNIPQLGCVILEDNVSIGANTTVDRATIGVTLIREGTKLDNLIQVAHNVVIGKNTVIAAQTGISGSTKIGDNCAIGGQVGLAGHIDIAKNTKIGAQAGLSSSIRKDGSTIIGSPAFDYRDFFKSSVVFRRLPDLEKRIKELEEKIANLSI